jgi:hypothetical protein
MIRELSRSALNIVERRSTLTETSQLRRDWRSMNARRGSLCIMSLTIMSAFPLFALAQNHEALPTPAERGAIHGAGF